MKKYDIFLANLNPKKGHAQAGMRPCVIIQSNLFNSHSSTALIVPLTTTKKNIFPSEFYITPSKLNGLSQKSRFLGSQIMTLDKNYLEKKLGSLENKYHSQVKESLGVALDWEDDFTE